MASLTGRSGLISRSFDLHSSAGPSTLFTKFKRKNCVDEQGNCNGSGFDANNEQFNSNNTPNKVPDETRMVNAHEAISLQHVANYGKTMPRLSPMTRKMHVSVIDRSLAQASLHQAKITSKA